ncbi:MAG TPA: hypothetical protein VE524_00135 [Nitrososphaeraceae archaeon]|nr:hypothetical protein [Nitrososphaeraceae archaeon]
MTAAPISTETTGTTTKTKTTENKELIEKLFEESKTKLKNEYDSMIIKIKEDLNNSKQQAISKVKKI